MPGGDGMGPSGKGRGTGKGCRRGRGKNPSNRGAEINSFCVCPSCGARVSHQQGIPCNNEKCPECGAAMIRA